MCRQVVSTKWTILAAVQQRRNPILTPCQLLRVVDWRYRAALICSLTNSRGNLFCGDACRPLATIRKRTERHTRVWLRNRNWLSNHVWVMIRGELAKSLADRITCKSQIPLILSDEDLTNHCLIGSDHFFTGELRCTHFIIRLQRERIEPVQKVKTNAK